MSSQAIRLCCYLLLCFSMDLFAHELNLVAQETRATRLTLTYPDGSAFAHESYELYDSNGELPVQVGRTDARGRIVFIPDTAGEWRVKAFSEDGHGIDRRFTITSAVTGQASLFTGVNQWYALVSGLAVLFGLFGIYQLFFRLRGDA